MAQAGSLFSSLALVVVVVGRRPVRLPAGGPHDRGAVAEGGARQRRGRGGRGPPRAPALGTHGRPRRCDGEDNVNLIEDVTKRMNRSPQKRLEQIVEYDEAQAAAILRQWLHQDEAA